MSLPVELFYPVGVTTCAMVFTAKIPHAESDKKTWFGYWKDDGFVKTKHRGRIDQYARWTEIRNRWVEAFKNRETHPGESVMHYVSASDEWCAEAYIEADYSKLTAEAFEKEVKKYIMFQIMSEESLSEAQDDDTAE